MVKHGPLMYNNVKKTFEILRSEITFLMDLYSVISLPDSTSFDKVIN